jgi:DNA-binding NarL/FixJ family response regulator
MLKYAGYGTGGSDSPSPCREKRSLPEIAAHLAEHYSDETLTGREIEILEQIAGGKRNRDIAGKLFISEGRCRK